MRLKIFFLICEVHEKALKKKMFLILKGMEQLCNKYFDFMIVSAENFINLSCGIKYYANIYFLSVCGHTHLYVHA